MEFPMIASYIPDKEILCMWLLNYGSFALFVLLALGIFALPVPEEGLMVLAGVLMSKGHLHVPLTLLTAYSGSMCGITMSYLFGFTVGAYFINKYGGWVGFTPQKIQAAHNWFERYGKWSLFFGYFVPGVRHFTGLAAGITKLKYLHFALFAYAGAFFWASLFLSIGYFINSFWPDILAVIETSIEEMVLFSVFVIILLIYLKMRKKNGL